jgi:hypothetical protein
MDGLRAAFATRPRLASGGCFCVRRLAVLILAWPFGHHG